MDRYDISSEPVHPKKRGPVRVSLGVLVICILLSGLIIFFTTYIALSSYYGRFSEMKKLQEVASLYEKNYLHDIDRDQLSDMLVKTYISGCGDRFASYYSAEEWMREQATASGKSVGIGIYASPSESGEICIAKIMENAPADSAGLLSGDIVTAIDGVRVKEVGYKNAVNLIAGEIGSQIVLEILRGEKTLTVTAVRSQYSPQTVYAETVLQDGKLYGYVYIVEFLSLQTTYNQFKTAVDGLIEAGVEGLIFDVRNNGGGEINTILGILDYLLPKGPLIHVTRVGMTDPITYSSDDKCVDLPMVVLANENTASAAELFTAALRDYDKAEVIGMKTFGKGCGQSGFMLSDGSFVFITSFLFSSPYSGSYDGIGLFPDHEVALTEKWQNKTLFLIPHEEDNQLIKAIEVIAGQVSDAQS